MNKNNIISDWLDKYGEPEIDKKVGIKLEKMNKGKYNQIIDEAYKNYVNTHEDFEWTDDFCKKNLKDYGDQWDIFSKEEFINKCKTDYEFSEKWGLKIEERELDLEERNEWFQVHLNGNNPFMEFDWKDFELDQQDIPTKLITLTHNETKIEIYE